jgi:transposase
MIGMQFYNLKDIAKILGLDYRYFWKYIKQMYNQEEKGVIRCYAKQYSIDDIINNHTFPVDEKIDIKKLIDEGVWTTKETYNFLLENGVNYHYTALWRRARSQKVTTIQINTAYRFPVYLVKKELEEGKYTER